MGFTVVIMAYMYIFTDNNPTHNNTADVTTGRLVASIFFAYLHRQPVILVAMRIGFYGYLGIVICGFDPRTV